MSRVRRWALAGGALLLGVLFVRGCVRIVPGGAPFSADRGSPAIAARDDDRPLLIPVAGVLPSALTDSFSQARSSGARAHDAIDIIAARGTPVLAAADGRIEKLFWSEAGGRTVYERSRDGRTVYYYAHLDSYAPALREGQAVRRGDAIATVGSTGNADAAAPHLHFAVQAMAPGHGWQGGRAVNPYPLLTNNR